MRWRTEKGDHIYIHTPYAPSLIKPGVGKRPGVRVRTGVGISPGRRVHPRTLTPARARAASQPPRLAQLTALPHSRTPRLGMRTTSCTDGPARLRVMPIHNAVCGVVYVVGPRGHCRVRALGPPRFDEFRTLKPPAHHTPQCNQPAPHRTAYLTPTPWPSAAAVEAPASCRRAPAACAPALRSAAGRAGAGPSPCGRPARRARAPPAQCAARP